MQVVLDTNIIRADWFLKSPSMVVIEKLITLGKCKLYVPEIVILETLNLYEKVVNAYAESVKKLNTLIAKKEYAVPYPDIEKICKDYEMILNERLNALKVQRLSYEGIPHQDVITRALACRKPFRESDKGYRDTLIWEGILRLANANCLTFFITNDRKDFASKAGGQQLHPDLVVDLVAKGLPAETVKLYPDVKRFVDEHISPYLQRLAGEVMESLKTGKYKSFSMQDWFIEIREQFIARLNEDAQSLFSWYGELENPEVSYVEDPEEIIVEDVYRLDEETVYLDAKAFADVTFDVFIFKPDYHWIYDKYPLDILSADWNEDFMWAQLTLYVPIRFSMIFNILSEQVEEFEVNGFEETFGWCKSCGAAVLSDAAQTCYRCGKSLFTAS